MAVDQATADWEQEQETFQRLQDSQAEWELDDPPSPDSELPLPPKCAQCVNWHPERQLRLADGSTQLAPGFCAVRAAADLPQMPQEYAEQCAFYEQDIPF